MFALVAGVLILPLEVSVVGNFLNLAGRMFEHASRRINPGMATVNTFRLGGLIVMAIGFFWIATALSEVLR